MSHRWGKTLKKSSARKLVPTGDRTPACLLHRGGQLLYHISWKYYMKLWSFEAASWRKRLAARLPPLGSRVRVSVPQCGFPGGRNEVWVDFLGVSPVFPYHKLHSTIFSTLISSISLHFIRPCDVVTGVVGRHPCYSRTFSIGASVHLIPRPDLVLDTSWG